MALPGTRASREPTRQGSSAREMLPCNPTVNARPPEPSAIFDTRYSQPLSDHSLLQSAIGRTLGVLLLMTEPPAVLMWQFCVTATVDCRSVRRPHPSDIPADASGTRCSVASRCLC